jgi:putative heme-binding domain-containing protein
MDYLIESVVDPDKRIREGFSAVTVATTDGDIFTGIQQSRNKEVLVLFDGTTRALRRIPVKDIEAVKPGKSIMPKNLPDSMTRSEFLDLVRFVNELGRPGEFATRNIPVVRTWRVLDPGGPFAKRLGSKSVEGRDLMGAADKQTWLPAYSMASGELPAAEFAGNTMGLARAKIEVGTAGVIQLRVNNSAGLKLFIDGKETGMAEVTKAEFSQGSHELTILVDFSIRPKDVGLKLFVEDAAGSKARAQVINGP